MRAPAGPVILGFQVLRNTIQYFPLEGRAVAVTSVSWERPPMRSSRTNCEWYYTVISVSAKVR